MDVPRRSSVLLFTTTSWMKAVIAPVILMPWPAHKVLNWRLRSLGIPLTYSRLLGVQMIAGMVLSSLLLQDCFAQLVKNIETVLDSTVIEYAVKDLMFFLDELG